MENESHKRLLDKCLQIYERQKWLYPVNQFLERLQSIERFEDLFTGDFWEDSLIPEIKNRYFPDESIDSLLEKSITRYRSTPDRSLALTLIWQEIEWKYPFTSDSYSEFEDRLDELLAKEPNPPTRADWDEFNEDIMK